MNDFLDFVSDNFPPTIVNRLEIALLQLRAGRRTSLSIQARSRTGESLTFTSRFHNLDTDHVSQSELDYFQTGNNLFEATLDWLVESTVTKLELLVANENGAIALVSPQIIMCACQNNAYCDFGDVSVRPLAEFKV